MKLFGQTAVITGASSGIGRALALEFGLRGARLILGARSERGLQGTQALLRAYGVASDAVLLDLNRAESIAAFAEAAGSLSGQIGVLVNNAGVGLFEETLASDPVAVEHLFRTNVWGAMDLTRRLVPHLSGGTLVNVSSAAGRYAPMHQGIYAASKAALDRLTEAIALETPSIRTLLVVPDRTSTPFMQHAAGDTTKTKLGLKLQFATPEHVATRTADALERDAALCYTTPKAHVYALLSVLAPGLLHKIIVRTS